MKLRTNTSFFTTLFLFAGGIVLAGAFAGGYFAGTTGTNRATTTQPDFAAMLPMILKADTASSSKTYSAATARIDDEIEALYVLDHVTKNLICFVINVNQPDRANIYNANLEALFGKPKQGDLELSMVTGFAALNQGGRSDQTRIAESFCYVLDGNSGIAAAFTFQFEPNGSGGQLVSRWQTKFRDPSVTQPAVAKDKAKDKTKEKEKDKAAPSDEKKK